MNCRQVKVATVSDCARGHHLLTAGNLSSLGKGEQAMKGFNRLCDHLLILQGDLQTEVQVTAC